METKDQNNYYIIQVLISALENAVVTRTAKAFKVTLLNLTADQHAALDALIEHYPDIIRPNRPLAIPEATAMGFRFSREKLAAAEELGDLLPLLEERSAASHLAKLRSEDKQNRCQQGR